MSRSKKAADPAGPVKPPKPGAAELSPTGPVPSAKPLAPAKTGGGVAKTVTGLLVKADAAKAGAAKTVTARRIIGVDPGLASTGWGVIDIRGRRLVHIAHGTIESKADRPQAERLFSIYTAFRQILEAYGPGESAMETLYFGRNVSSALPVAEARGVLSLALAEQGLAVMEFSPNAIKKAVTGVSRADKSQIQEMVRLILGLDGIPKPDHAADALAMAICSANTLLL